MLDYFHYVMQHFHSYQFMFTKKITKIVLNKVIMQVKLFQRCTHLLYCSVLSQGGNVNTRGMSQPDMGFIFHSKNQWNILVKGNYNV